MKPPIAKKVSVTHNDHGIERADPYGWLKNKQQADVITHLEAENAYTEVMMHHTEGLRKELYNEMLNRIQEDDTSAPYQKGDWWCYTKTVSGKPYAIHCRRKGDMEAPEQVILDENELASGKDYYHLSAFSVSPDHNYVAWIEDSDGAEQFVLRVRDLRTGSEDEQLITGLKWSLAWGDNETVFYVRGDHAQRPFQIWKRKLFSPPESDTLVWEDLDERFFLSVRRSRNGKFVVLSAVSKVTSDVRVLPTDDLQAEPSPVLARNQGIEYSVACGTQGFWVLSNENAQNFKLLQVNGSSVTEVISHDESVFLESVQAFAQWVVIWYRQDGLRGVRFIDAHSLQAKHLHFPDEAYQLSSSHNPDFNATEYRLRYSSMITPNTTFAFAFADRSRRTLKVTPVKGGYNPEEYVCRRLWATARDGTKVPISIAHKADLSNTVSPTLLYGYGSYGSSYPAGFRSSWVSLLERGVCVAIAHIRGGSEMGRQWYENGKFFHKKNTFRDFIDCASFLISQGITSQEQLAITGGSAGGLLMGAVLNMRPDLCKACVARVPFVDVVNTMLDPNLPLTVIEYEEWGNPNEKEVFEYMLSYSPYDNVSAVVYPHLMVTAGLNDPRVGYWEPAKWVARLREMSVGDNSLIFKTHMGAGHSGASGRYGYLEDTAWMFAFVLDHIGN